MALRERLIYAIEVTTDKAQQGLKGFKSAVGDAEGATAKLKAGASSAFSTIKANAGVAAVAIGTTFVAAGVKAIGSFQDLALSAGKFSDATGLAVDDASRWIEVAHDMGLSTETVEGLFVKLNKAIGSGSPIAAKYGVDLKKTADGAADVSATMLNAIDAVTAIKDPTERARASTALFGKSYAEASELIFNGSGKITASLAAVQGSKVIDQAELEKARKFREEMDTLRDAAEGVSITVGAALIPAVEHLIGWFDGAFAAGRRVAEVLHLQSAKNNDLIDSWDKATTTAATFNRSLLDNARSVAQVRDIVIKTTGDVTAANIISVEWKKSLDAQTDALKAAFAASGEYTSGVVAAGVAEQEHKNHVDDVRDAIFREGEITAKAKDATADKAAEDEKAAAQAQKHADALQAVADAMEAERSKALELVGGTRAVREAQRAAAEKADALNQILADQSTTLGEAGAAIDDTADAYDNAAQQAADYRQTQMEANGETVDAATKAQLFKEELQKLADHLNGPLKDAILAEIANLDELTKPRTATVTLNLPGRVGDTVLAPHLGTAAYGASGGIVNRPTVALIGEAGPEAVIPLSQTAGNGPLPGMGGNTYHFNINVQQPLTPQQVVTMSKKFARFNGDS